MSFKCLLPVVLIGILAAFPGTVARAVPPSFPANPHDVTTTAGATATAKITARAAVALTVTAAPVSKEAMKGAGSFFSIEVMGSEPITYQWWRNGAPLADATWSTYGISSVSSADAGEYTVVVTNPAGSITSSAVTLTVLPPELPQIIEWPPGYSFGADSNVALFLTITGAGPLSYQWFKDGVAIPGATGSSYFKGPPQTQASAGIYTLQVTNEAGLVVSPDLVMNWQEVAPTGDLWTSVARQGDVAYFLMATPSRILRYDLAAEAWLPAVDLTPGKAVTAFLPTAEGVFIAYGNELVRRTLDLQGETVVGTCLSSIDGLFAAREWIYFRERNTANQTTHLRSYIRASLAPGPANSLGFRTFSGLRGPRKTVYSPLSGRIFSGPGDDDVEWYKIDSGGLITDSGDSPYHGEFDVGGVVTLFPDELRLITNAGVIYSNPDLTYEGSLGERFDDVAFLADGSIVALRGRTLVAYAGKGWAENGRRTLAVDGAALFRRNARLIVFGLPATKGSNPVVQALPANSITPPPATLRGSALNRKISLDGVFLDANKVVNIVSRSEKGIVRWDAVSRQFLPTLPLRGAPVMARYAPTIDRLVLAYSDGVLSDLFLTAAPVEQLFGGVPVLSYLSGMVVMDELVGLNFNASFNLVLDAEGAKTNNPARDPSPFDLWLSPSRRVFIAYADARGGNGASVEVSATGALVPLTAEYGTNLVGPLRATPEGTLLLSMTGHVFTPELQLTGLLGNKVADGAWLTDAIYTIRVRPEGTQLQKWTRVTYALAGQLNLPGIPQRIFRLDDSNVVVVTTVDGYLVFNLVSSALEKIATVANDPSFVPDRPTLFNAEAYLANNPDVATVIGNPPDRAQQAWAHYWKTGVTEGRTDGDFNVQAYLTQYPNLAAIYGPDLKGAALHWYTVGRAQGLRIPTGFDVVAYLARHLDIYALFKNDKYGAWLHFFNYGLNEGRDFDANFVVDEYLELNPDIKAAFGTNRQAALLHWFQYGHPIEDRMGRVPIGFNVDKYLARYPDLAGVLGGITPRAVRNVTTWHQYLAYGVLESRSDGDFEANAYLASNPDLAAVYGTDVRGAALHWFFYGRREGRRIPALFDVHYYRTRYPDIVVIFGDDLYGSWLHYLDWGIPEGRIFDQLFRPDDYIALNPDLAPLIGNDRELAVLHWLHFGKAAGRPGRY